MDDAASPADPAKFLLLANMLAKDGIITNNAKGFLKEVILRRDPRLKHIANILNTPSGDDAMDDGDEGGSNFLKAVIQLIEEEAEDVYEELFAECSLHDGKQASRSERDDKSLSGNKSFTYGEVEFRSFSKILRKIQRPKGAKFCDLGSGTGKALFVARFMHDFDACLGIEILDSLHELGLGVLQKYNAYFRQFLMHSSEGDVQLVRGSITQVDWSDCDVVFANSTCFDDDLMEDVSVLAEKLKPGSYVITFTKGLDSDKFEIMERKRYKMSWGPATVFIHRRLTDEGLPASSEQLIDIPDDESFHEDDDEDEDDSDDDEQEQGGGNVGVSQDNDNTASLASGDAPTTDTEEQEQEDNGGMEQEEGEQDEEEDDDSDGNDDQLEDLD